MSRLFDRRKVVEIQPDNPPLMFRVIFHLDMDAFYASVEQRDDAFVLRGYPSNKHLEAAEGWLELGNWREANEELENITTELRVHPFVLEVRYKIYCEAKRWDEAVEIARTLTEMLPDSPCKNWRKGWDSNPR